MRGRMLVGHLHFDRVLGLLAKTIGIIDDAIDHFEGALAFCRRAGYRPELAWTCYDYAEMLVGAGFTRAPTDRQKASALIEEGLAIATELGMRPLVERVVALKDKAGLQPAKAPAYPDGLTEREVEVLRLVATGKTNQEIADVLFISVNTVIRHVSNIFSKTGSANRADASTYASRKGLMT